MTVELTVELTVEFAAGLALRAGVEPGRAVELFVGVGIVLDPFAEPSLEFVLATICNPFSLLLGAKRLHLYGFVLPRGSGMTPADLGGD